MTAKLTDMQILAEIENLQVTARQVALGALAGMHRSLRRGTSIEFSEHKLYTPGDDIRHIDWRAYAKTDRYHVKQFEDETNLRLEILIDHSGSMAFGSHGTTRLDYARTLAAALSYLALRQGDAVGLCAFGQHITEQLPPRASSSHLVEILARLVKLSPEGPTGLAACLDRFCDTQRRRSVLVLLSDLFDPNPDLIDALHRLSARRHDVAVLHLLDPAEVEFPYENPAVFSSLEDARRLFVHPRTLRNTFVKEMHKFLERTARALSEASIDYHRVMLDTAPAQALGTFLRGRHSRPIQHALTL